MKIKFQGWDPGNLIQLIVHLQKPEARSPDWGKTGITLSSSYAQFMPVEGLAPYMLLITTVGQRVEGHEHDV